MERKAYPSDISDEEWGFVAPYLTLMTEEAPQRDYSWVVERSFGWAACFHRLAQDYERLPETLIGLHFWAFAILMAKRVVETMLIVHRS